MAPPSEQPLWVKILLNICDMRSVGVGLASLGVLSAVVGLGFLLGTILYVDRELYPNAGQFVRRRSRMGSLMVFIGRRGRDAMLFGKRIAEKELVLTVTKTEADTSSREGGRSFAARLPIKSVK